MENIGYEIKRKRMVLTFCLVPANLVLQSTVERLYVNDAYCDIQRGVFIVRGENVLLLGEIVCDASLLQPALPSL